MFYRLRDTLMPMTALNIAKQTHVIKIKFSLFKTDLMNFKQQYIDTQIIFVSYKFQIQFRMLIFRTQVYRILFSNTEAWFKTKLQMKRLCFSKLHQNLDIKIIPN